MNNFYRNCHIASWVLFFMLASGLAANLLFGFTDDVEILVSIGFTIFSLVFLFATLPTVLMLRKKKRDDVEDFFYMLNLAFIFGFGVFPISLVVFLLSDLVN